MLIGLFGKLTRKGTKKSIRQFSDKLPVPIIQPGVGHPPLSRGRNKSESKKVGLKRLSQRQ
jgi:hypothetical protein